MTAPGPTMLVAHLGILRRRTRPARSTDRRTTAPSPRRLGRCGRPRPVHLASSRSGPARRRTSPTATLDDGGVRRPRSHRDRPRAGAGGPPGRPSSRSADGAQVALRGAHVEPVAVATHSAYRTPLRHHGGEGLAFDVDPPRRRDAVQDGGLEDVGPGVDQVGRRGARRRLLDERFDPAVSGGGHDAERATGPRPASARSCPRRRARGGIAPAR